MFEYISSFVIIAFEVIFCKLFFESFYENLRKDIKQYKKIYMLLMIFVFHTCSLLLIKRLVIKQISIIIAIAILMYLYYEISLTKSIILAILYQGLGLII